MQPKILLVDDREDNLLSMETVLQADGYRFVKANSGRQVLKTLLTDIDFALILMDVRMPNLDGFETASLVYEREKLRHIPIIFITANNYGEENVFKGYRAGAVDYIYKPVNPDLLRAKVAVFIDIYRKNQRLLQQEQKLVSINKSLELEINERKNSEEKIKILNKQLLDNITRLESANKELDLFAFMASHDLQAPLRKIRMFGDRLLHHTKDKLDPESLNYIRRMQEVSKKMQDLINDLLEFSRISAEKRTYEDVDMTALVNEVLQEMETSIQEQKASVQLDPLPVLPVNPVLMKPLFHNLIGNSLKYARENIPAQIHIYAEMPSPVTEIANRGTENLYCRLFVVDNGIGFDQKYAEEIFDMFRRLHPSAAYEGTGIGLALCKKVAEKHNGFISARGKINEGATFVVSLPLKQSPVNTTALPGMYTNHKASL